VNDLSWEVIDEVVGEIQAELLRGLLEAQGIQVWLSQEGIGHSIYPVNIPPLGKIQILTPANQSQAARVILEDYYAGKFDNVEWGTPPDETTDQG
jgi:hypothetical protein